MVSMNRWFRICAAFACVVTAQVAAGIPMPRGCVDIPGGYTEGFAVGPSHAYCSTRQPTTLTTFDVSDPDSPELVSSVELHALPSGWWSELVRTDEALFGVLSDYNRQMVLAFDLLDPGQPVVADTLAVEFGGRLAVSGPLLGLAGQYGLALIDASDPYDLQYLSSIPLNDGYRSAAIAGDYLYLSVWQWNMADSDTLSVYDVTNPSAPDLRQKLPLDFNGDCNPNGLLVSGNLLVVYGRSSSDYSTQILTYDLSNPASPVLLGGVATNQEYHAVSLSGDLLAVSFWPGDVVLYDLSTPANPQEIGRFTPGGDVGDLGFVANALILVQDDLPPPYHESIERLLTVGLAGGPYPPEPGSCIALPPDSGAEGWHLVRFGRSGYDHPCEAHQQVVQYFLFRQVGWRGNGRAEIVGELPPELDLTFLPDFPPGDWAVVGSAPAILQDLYQILVAVPPGAESDPYLVLAATALPQVYYLSLPFTPTPVEDLAVLTTRVLGCKPNPFNPATEIRFAVPAGGDRLTLDIVDVRGRLVQRLADRTFAEGTHVVRWDGRNDRGGMMPAGVYFARVRAAGVDEVVKLTLLP